MSTPKKKVGFWIATSLVVGNMIGAGIFLLPATLAGKGSISILGWLFTAAGAIVLARIFGNFSKLIVNKSGGPYTYSKAGFGDFIGFLVAWGYWISCWVANAAITVAIIGALSVFFPVLEEVPLVAICAGLGIIWLLTWVNTLGVPNSGRVQLVTTILKLAPLFFVILAGLFYFNLDNFPPFNLTGAPDWKAIPIVAALTLYAFLGVESATIPAADIKDPARTIPRATLVGTLLTTTVYVLGTVVLFGVVPWQTLSTSAAPFADAGKVIGGDFAEYVIAGGAAVAGIGALNGWILITGQIPMAIAKDKLFPRPFGKENKKGAPSFGLVIGSILTSLLLLLNFSDTLVDQFEFLGLLTVFTVLIPYVFVSAAYVMVKIQKDYKSKTALQAFTLGFAGLSYSIWMVYGAQEEIVFNGLLLLLSGIPFYLIVAWRKKT